ncbi:hypothetical protein SY88_09415 [Clostridiales bacterium PH28_bin88]|nr:hypothetical protein SY88_09415 [Clostridiales bacterium PH28_bin88]
MPVWSECVRRAKAYFQFGLNTALVVGLVAVSLTFRYPGKHKSIIYAVFRDVAKQNMVLRTFSWPTVQSPRFLLRYRPEDADVARLVLETAEEAYQPVVDMLGYAPPEPVPVVVYPDRQSMGRSFGWDADQGAMGVYWAGVIRVLSPGDWTGASDLSAMARTFKKSGPMVHEFAHLVVDYRTGGNYPRWFTEGVAQYVEREITGFQFSVPGNPGEEKWYPLERMDGEFDYLPDQGLAYRQSLAMVDYMIDLGGFNAVLKLVEHLGQGNSMEQAMNKVFGLGLGDFSAAFEGWAVWAFSAS